MGQACGDYLAMTRPPTSLDWNLRIVLVKSGWTNTLFLTPGTGVALFGSMRHVGMPNIQGSSACNFRPQAAAFLPAHLLLIPCDWIGLTCRTGLVCSSTAADRGYAGPCRGGGGGGRGR